MLGSILNIMERGTLEFGEETKEIAFYAKDISTDAYQTTNISIIQALGESTCRPIM